MGLGAESEFTWSSSAFTQTEKFHDSVLRIVPSRMPSLNFMMGEDPLSLDRIRSVLVRLEDTIIFSLIERAQFTHSPRIYQKGSFTELADIGFSGTWLDWFLKETEIFHGKILFHIIPLSF